jgi:hypothetical protein
MTSPIWADGRVVNGWQGTGQQCVAKASRLDGLLDPEASTDACLCMDRNGQRQAGKAVGPGCGCSWWVVVVGVWLFFENSTGCLLCQCQSLFDTPAGLF